jgi:predicted transcriptional regulator
MLTKFYYRESEFYPFGVSIDIVTDITSKNVVSIREITDFIHNVNDWLNNCNIQTLQCMQISSHIWGFKTESDRMHMLLAWS